MTLVISVDDSLVFIDSLCRDENGNPIFGERSSELKALLRNLYLHDERYLKIVQDEELKEFFLLPTNRESSISEPFIHILVELEDSFFFDNCSIQRPDASGQLVEIGLNTERIHIRKQLKQKLIHDSKNLIMSFDLQTKDLRLIHAQPK